MTVRDFLAIVSGLAAFCCQAAEPIAYMPPSQLTRIASPLVQVPAEHHHRLDERMVRMRRFVIPHPGLLVVFGEGGCVTALVNIEAGPPKDNSCIGIPGLPGRDELLSAVRRAPAANGLAQPSMIVFSPLYDVAAYQAVFDNPAFHRRMAEDGDRLRKFVAELRERHPELVILEVLVGL